MKIRTRWLGMLVATLMSLHVPVAAQDLDTERRAVRARFCGEVEELAGWAQEHRLYLQRDRLYEALLALRPDHAEARRFLHYRKTKAGWVRAAYSVPEDRGTESLAEFAARRAALESEWCAALTELCARFDAERDGRARAWLYDDLVILAPDNAQARDQRGEVRSDGGWILRETAAGRVRRAHLSDRAAELRGVEPAPEGVRPAADALAGWREASLPVGRVVAADLSAEALHVLALSQAAAALFRETFGEAPILPANLTVYVLDGANAKREFLAKQRDARVRSLAEKHDSFWIPQSPTLVLCGASSELRSGHGVRQLIQRMLTDSYALGPDSAWVLEGISLRLGELVTGNAEFARNAGLPLEAAGLKRGEHLWREARALLAREGRPRLARLFGRRVEDFTREDVLLAYALACYLMEARPERLARLLDELGHGEAGDAEGILERELGLASEALDARLARWAAEMGE